MKRLFLALFLLATPGAWAEDDVLTYEPLNGGDHYVSFEGWDVVYWYKDHKLTCHRGSAGTGTGIQVVHCPDGRESAMLKWLDADDIALEIGGKQYRLMEPIR